MVQNGTHDEVPDDPAGRHSYDAARFTALVESATTEDWARPSPVAEWTALGIVEHLIEWSRGFLKGAGIDLEPLDIEADPEAAWKRHVADKPGLAARTLTDSGGSRAADVGSGPLPFGRS